MPELSTAISSNDCIQPFYFRTIAARGALVKLSNSFVEARNGHNYPNVVNSLLGQSLAATVLMSTHLKFSSRLSLQARSTASQTAPISLMLAETTMRKVSEEPGAQSLTIRGLARLTDEPVAADSAISLDSLLGTAQLAITIEPEKQQRYQGIVDAQAASLAESLEDYFRQSEQLATQLLLFAAPKAAAGLILQEMPNHGGKSEQCPIGFADQHQATIWEELKVLASSITPDELFNLTADDCLQRLFHQHDYALAEPAAVNFACSCSQERTGDALRYVEAAEIDAILQEDGEIVMDCEFCSSRYRFDKKAIDLIRGSSSAPTIN